MKNTVKNHWYDPIVRLFNGKSEEETNLVSQNSLNCSVPAIALPMIEEWAIPEDYAA